MRRRRHTSDFRLQRCSEVVLQQDQPGDAAPVWWRLWWRCSVSRPPMKLGLEPISGLPAAWRPHRSKYLWLNKKTWQSPHTVSRFWEWFCCLELFDDLKCVWSMSYFAAEPSRSSIVPPRPSDSDLNLLCTLLLTLQCILTSFLLVTPCTSAIFFCIFSRFLIRICYALVFHTLYCLPEWH